jgi:uncharacterized protein (TIRG00374 family)
MLALAMGDGAAPRRVSLGERVERAVEARTDLAAEIERGERTEPPPGRLRRNLIWLGITAVSLYLVFPSLVQVFGSWHDVTQLSPGWLGLMALLQVAVLACLWGLQRLALHLRRWRPIIASQLAGNALSKVAPGGGAMGAALQYRMLADEGLDRPRVIAGLTAVNLLTFGFVTALPVLAIPALLRGGVDHSLVQAAVVALGLLVLLIGLGAMFLALDRPLERVAGLIQRVRNRLRRHAEPLTGLPSRLVHERDRIVATLGPHWKSALFWTAGRWAFDYATLFAALAAVGSHPRPGLALLAFTAAQVLGQIPVTPGGLGFVEAGLTGMLTLAGVAPADAVLATFAYRLFSFWLPIPFGLLGLALHRRRVARLLAARAAAAGLRAPAAELRSTSRDLPM